MTVIDFAALEPNTAFIIGRGPPCDVELADRSLSRHHARITTIDGEIWLEDLGSINGTFVDGRRITERHKLSFDTQAALGLVALGIEAHGVGDAYACSDGARSRLWRGELFG